MDEQFLIEGEEVITRSGGGEVVLTNKRLRFGQLENTPSQMRSILLANIALIEIEYQVTKSYLTTSVIAFLAAIALYYYNYEIQFTIGLAIIGAIFLMMYFSSRRHRIRVTSKGGKGFPISTSGMPSSKVLKFVNSIEENILLSTVK